ncbi:hypothetical protein, partial [Ensifer adhaerens]|uniref:hypothetical protein n=1 Tax=Ensifer adhaerens TaxID=106592 RepID=UPI001AECB614
FFILSFLLKTRNKNTAQKNPSEPRFLANVQRYFSDFPYFPSLLDQRLCTLETCCGDQYECLGKTQHQLVVYDTLIHFDAIAHNEQSHTNKIDTTQGGTILQESVLLRQMTYFQRTTLPTFKKKRQLFSNEQQYSRAYLLSPVVSSIISITTNNTKRSQRQFQNIN